MAGVSAQELEAAIKERLAAVEVIIVDLSGGCGQNFEVIIVSPVFKGKNVLQKHRMVNEALKGEIARLHAFSQKSFTPEDYESYKAKQNGLQQ